MPYPIVATGTIAPGAVLNTAFRPVQAGLVNVTVSGTGIPLASGTGGTGGSGGSTTTPGQSTELSVSIKLEVFKPGTATPVISRVGGEFLDVGAAFLWGEFPAAASDLGADWTVRITNTGKATQAQCVVVVRYQVMAGNAGKIDHIVVLMMENRSFDHMLGYLSLSKHDGGGDRFDIDGLTGQESNPDLDGKEQQVAARSSTFFINDPGHGLPDVEQQLCTRPAQNQGFVTDFQTVVKKAGPQAHTINQQAVVPQANVHNISFRQGSAGQITLLSAPIDIPSGTQSDSGLLAKLNLFKPGSIIPIASVSANLKGPPQNLELTYMATDADVAVAGNWTCQVSNTTDVDIMFQTKVNFFQAPESPGAIMEYHTAAQVPTYDFLAREYTVCDRWFAAVPTDTWPNRLYSLTGGAGGLYTTPTDADVTANPPGFSMKTIFEVLQARAVEWGIFFSDLPFALIFKQLAQDATYTARMRPVSDFLDRAKTGDLPAVSWIDPNFSDVPDGEANANDDTPPGDITPGQAFVGQIYNALAASPAWSKTLLVVIYDEHGGFYDHVTPPGTPIAPGKSPVRGGPPDDDATLARYGVRVPAFVISPWVAPKSVSKVVHDHTSVLRTILLRFCADGGVPSMGKRTDNANELSPLLSGATPRVGATAPAINVVVPPVAAISPDAFGNVLRKTILGL
jgi:phospholipase C